MVKIAPSVLSADFAKLGEEVKAIEKAGATWLHYDVMDGHFVPNISFGPKILKDISSLTSLFIDVHLMVEEPFYLLPAFMKAGAQMITVHIEAVEDFSKYVDYLKKEGIQVGITLRPSTPLSSIEPYLPDIDMVLVMSVEPGFGGQSFIPESLDRIRELDRIRKERNLSFLIEVDGGINQLTSKQVVLAGADVLVAGSYVFLSDDYAKAIESLR